jgi:hypothetical protein
VEYEKNRAFNFEADPAAEKERFVIHNDKMAEWAMGKIAEANANIKMWKEFYKQKLAQALAEEEDTIAYMSGLLREYFDTQPHHVTKTGIEKYSLPSGTLELKPGGLDYKRDNEALLAWCKANMPAAVKVTEEPAWEKVKAYIKETGEIPDGVEPFQPEAAFTVRNTKEGK